jgi:hypothetical protein
MKYFLVSILFMTFGHVYGATAQQWSSPHGTYTPPHLWSVPGHNPYSDDFPAKGIPHVERAEPEDKTQHAKDGKMMPITPLDGMQSLNEFRKTPSQGMTTEKTKRP